MNGSFPANGHNPAGPFPSFPPPSVIPAPLCHSRPPLSFPLPLSFVPPSVIPAPPLSFPRKRESREARSPRGHFSVILSEEKDLPFASRCRNLLYVGSTEKHFLLILLVN